MKATGHVIFLMSIIACFGILQTKVYAGEVEVPAGTPIKLEVVNTITSEEAVIGQVVHLVVVRDVQIQGMTVIKGGTPAEGTITKVKGKGTLGEPGEVQISVKRTVAVDGTEVPLRDTLFVKGKAGAPYSVQTTRDHMFLFMEGEPVQILGGVELRAYIRSPVKVRVNR